MDKQQMMAIVESILFISGDPVSITDISKVLNIDVDLAGNLMERMMQCFGTERRGLQIVKVNDTYQLTTRPEYVEYIRSFIGENHEHNLSQACLETLSIIAYRQPVVKSDIELLRGVKSDHSVAVLLEKGLIKEMGRMDTPGRPKIYGTTDLFLRSFGLSTIEDLPPLNEQENI